MKYCICNETFQNWNWHDTCRQVAEFGYRYIEVAPFTLAKDVRELTSEQRIEIKSCATEFGLQIVGLHWLLVSPPGLSITGDSQEVRIETASYLCELANLCADLGGSTMVLGSPAQRRLPTPETTSAVSPRQLALERLLEVISPALEICDARGLTLCLEPLPSPEADFMLTLKETTEIVKTVNRRCLKTMLDIKSASSETTAIDVLVHEYSDVIHHVHVNDANRRGPGFGETDFVPILRALNEVSYDGPVSIEVFDYTPDPITIASQSLAYLQQCEASAAGE